jgi:hypothetical protein
MGRAVALLCLLVPAVASADAGARVREHLEAGRKLYQELEYRKAVRELAPIKTDPAATRAQRLEALELIGLASFILGDEEGAREAFEDLLSIDPGYELREASGAPKIRAFFDDVKKAYLPDYKPGERVTIEHDAPSGATAGRKIELDAHVTAGEDVVKEIVLLWRRRGVLAYTEARLQVQGSARWRARLTPPADPDGYVLEYYLEARDVAGKSVSRVAGPETPLTIAVRGAAPEPIVTSSPWYKKWYVWAGAGAVLFVGIGAYGIAATAGDVPSGSLADVDLGK